MTRPLVTLRLLEAQTRRIQRKHPGLERLCFRSCTLEDAPLGDISAIIRQAWRRSYGDRISISYRPALLRLAGTGAEGLGLVTLAEDDSGLCGVILGLPVDCELPPSTGPATLTTGLCSTEAREGSGIIEMLLARHSSNLMEEGHSFSLHWRAASEGQTPDKARLAHAGRVPLWAKPLDCNRAARLGHLPWWQGMALRWLAWRHPAGRPLTDGLVVEPFNPSHAMEYAAFLGEHHQERGLRRRFSGKCLRRRCLFDEDGIRGFALAFREGGNLAGFAHGYVNPVNDEGDAYFAVDGAVFHPFLPEGRRAACLSAFEGAVRDQFGCFAVMAPGSVSPLPMGRLGYMPVRRYHIGALAYQPPENLSPESVAGMMLELR